MVLIGFFFGYWNEMQRCLICAISLLSRPFFFSRFVYIIRIFSVGNNIFPRQEPGFQLPLLDGYETAIFSPASYFGMGETCWLCLDSS